MRDMSLELGETLLWAKRIRVENVALNKKLDTQERTIQFLQSQAESQSSDFTAMRKQLQANTALVEKLNAVLTQQHQRDMDREAELDQLVQINEKAITEIDTSSKSLARYVQDMKAMIDRDILQVIPELQSKQEEHSEDMTTLVENIQELQEARTKLSHELWCHENSLANIDADREAVQRNMKSFARTSTQVDADLAKTKKNAIKALDLAQEVRHMVVEQGEKLESLLKNPAYSSERSTTVAKPRPLKEEPTVSPVPNQESMINSQATTQWDNSVPPPSPSPELESSQPLISPRPARLVREKARALPVPNFQLPQTTGRVTGSAVQNAHPMLSKGTSISDQMSSLPLPLSSQFESPEYSQMSEIPLRPNTTTGTTPPPLIILDSIEPASSNVTPANRDARSANTSAKRQADVVVDSQSPVDSPITAPPAKKKYVPNRKISLDNW